MRNIRLVVLRPGALVIWRALVSWQTLVIWRALVVWQGGHRAERRVG